MRLWERIKRFFTIKTTNALKKGEDPIQVLEYELEKSHDNITKLGDKISSVRADRQVSLDEKKKIESEISRATQILDQAVEQDDNEIGEEAIALKEKNEAKLEVITSNIKYYDDVISKLEEQHSNLKVKYEDKATRFEKLKMQAKFAKNMKSINEEIRKNYSGDDIDFSGIDSIEKEIEHSAYYEADRNKEVTAGDSLTTRMNQASAKSKFEEYKRRKTSGVEVEVEQSEAQNVSE